MTVSAEEIEHALRPLLGLPLSDMSRFSGWQRFEFGPQKPHVNRRGEDITRADYAVHVACGWRIVSQGGVLVGSDDYGPGSERHDEQAKPFFKRLAHAPPVVASLRGEMTGSVHFEMTEGFSLDNMPMGAIRETQWLFLLPDGVSFALDEQGFGS